MEVMDLLPGSQSMPRYYSIKRYSTHTQGSISALLTIIHFCLAHRENNTPGREACLCLFVKYHNNHIVDVR